MLLLGLLALFGGVSFTLVARRVEAQQRDAQLINVAGRQRTYSQRIALLGLQLVLPQDGGQRQSLRDDLQQALAEMADAHALLIDSTSTLYPESTPSQNVQDLYFGASALDEKVKAFLAAGNRLVQTPDARLSLLNPDLGVLESAAQGSLLPALDTVVTIDGIHVKERLSQLNDIALASLMLTLITLGVVGMGILFPLLRRQERTVAELERERNFVQQVLDNLGQGLGISGEDNLYRYVNPAYARMVGRTPEAMIGTSSFDMIAPEEHARLIAARAERRAGRSTERNITFQRPDGSSVQTLTVVVPYKTEAGGIGGVAVVTDLTERIQAEQQLRQRDLLYRTVAANFPDGTLMLFDRALRYTLADGTGLAAVGLSAELLEGRTPHEVYPQEVAEVIEADYRQALLGQMTEREMTVGDRTYLVKTLPLTNAVVTGVGTTPSLDPADEIFGGMSISQDITQRRQAEHDLNRASVYTAALLEVSRLAQSDLAPEEVAFHAATVVGRSADIDWAGLAVREGEIIKAVTAWHPESDDPGALAFLKQMELGMQRGNGLVWKATETAQAMYIDDYPSQPGANPVNVDLGVQNVAFLPLATIGEEEYLIAMVRRQVQRPWTQGDRELFQTAARTVQISLERRQHLVELERAALIDALTGLGNRRAFERDLERELERSRRSGEGVGVLMVDLDGLKQINDVEGHDRGDALLVSFAQTLSASLRAEDRVYRLGGDEYAAILVRASLNARETLEMRVRRAVGQTRLTGFPEVDASAGMAFAPQEVRQAGDLLRRADERMYIQKQEHRQARRANSEA